MRLLGIIASIAAVLVRPRVVVVCCCALSCHVAGAPVASKLARPGGLRFLGFNSLARLGGGGLGCAAGAAVVLVVVVERAPLVSQPRILHISLRGQVAHKHISYSALVLGVREDHRGARGPWSACSARRFLLLLFVSSMISTHMAYIGRHRLTQGRLVVIETR